MVVHLNPRGKFIGRGGAEFSQGKENTQKENIFSHEEARYQARQKQTVGCVQCSFLNRCKRLGFCDNTVPTISDIFSNADDSLFQTISKNISHHVLYPYFPVQQYINTINAHITKPSCLKQLT